jgi:hypothetical protein
VPVYDVTAWKFSKTEEQDSGLKCGNEHRSAARLLPAVIWTSGETKARDGHDVGRDIAAAGKPEYLSFCEGQPT